MLFRRLQFANKREPHLWQRKLRDSTQHPPLFLLLPVAPRIVRSPRDNTQRSLRLTESVLEHTNAAGSPLVLHLADVIGANAGPVQAEHSSAEGEVHHLEVFAYVPSSKG